MRSRTWAVFLAVPVLALPEAFPAGLTLVEEGGSLDPSTDLALEAGAAPFALDELNFNGIHVIAGLNDGIYGNLNSWIGKSGNPGFAGLRFAGLRTVASIAFGRDNTGTYADRTLGAYVLQVTTAEAPDATTPDEAWVTIGETVVGAFCPRSPGLRHRHNFTPVEATGIRLLVPLTTDVDWPGGTCIDELEAYEEIGDVFLEPCTPPEELTLVEVGGDFAEDDVARFPFAYPFAIDSLFGFPNHDVAGLNDGIYGNGNSWIGESGNPGFAGIGFGELLTISSIAFGRDNTGTYSERTLGTYVLQFTDFDMADASTPDDSWTTIGSITNSAVCPPGLGLRHRYNFPPVEATAIRLIVPGVGIASGACIDELEVYEAAGEVLAEPCRPPALLHLEATGGPSATPATEGDVPSFEAGNAARAPDALPFGTPPFPAPAHTIPGLTDGLYGNGHSWLGISAGPASGKVYGGIYFLDGPRRVKGIALGRDNTGAAPDRVTGPHVVQVTADEFAPEDDASVEAAAWTTLGEARSHLGHPAPGLRRVYSFDPVTVRAVRVVTAVENAFDEIELVAAEDLPGKPRFHRGDADGSGRIDLSDAILILGFLFLGVDEPPCREAANADDSTVLDLTDTIYILQYLFLGGPSPAAPGPESSPCGTDPDGSPADLGCILYAPCGA